MTDRDVLTTVQVAERFNVLAQQEKWFEIQDELFSDEVESIEPPGAKYLSNAKGKLSVRKKGEAWISRIEAFHSGTTSKPLIGGDFFAVARDMDITVSGEGRVQISQLMLYHVINGRIISEQFFY